MKNEGKKSKGQIILVGLLILMVLFIGKVYMNNKENEKLENQNKQQFH